MKKIKIDLLDGHMLALTTSKAEAQKYIDRNMLDYSIADDELGVTICPQNDSATLVCVFDGSILTAAHECLHAAIDTLDQFGIKYNRNNHEILAYTHQYLFKRMLDAMADGK